MSDASVAVPASAVTTSSTVSCVFCASSIWRMFRSLYSASSSPRSPRMPSTTVGLSTSAGYVLMRARANWLRSNNDAVGDETCSISVDDATNDCGSNFASP